MKRIYFIILIAMLCLQSPLSAQNTDKPWAMGFAFSGLDYRAADGSLSRIYHLDNWNFGGKFLVGRALGSSFNLVGSAAFNETDSRKAPDGGFEENISSSGVNFDFDLGLQYKFANGYIIHENSWFDPYLHVGGGVAVISERAKGLLNAGIGTNLWLNPKEDVNVGFFYQVDYDWVNKFNDYLHHSMGVKFRFGAKDSDGDGISDTQDRCPSVPGLKTMNGCPDSDADGIADKDDTCPNAAGLASLSGCPDRDEDGVADKDDNCPDVAGLSNMGGCPDSDGDGVVDKDDNCPQVAGLATLAGCPDSDGDGIADKDDNCPQVAGSKSLNGCPDSDGDGIADKDDKCPQVAGVASEQGCPEKKIDKEEVEKKLSMSASLIQFNTGSSTIKQESLTELDKIIAIMSQYPDSKFRIEGYTDNVGNAGRNKALSQRRADAVKKYFVDKNISAGRLTSTGYGIAKPVAPNTTAAGRAKNRRVEIHLAN